MLFRLTSSNDLITFKMASLMKKPAFPFLVYSYPWMPYPRLIGIYLREKRIPSSLVRIVPVADPYNGDAVIDSESKYPPRPKGSLPVLAIHSASDFQGDVTYIRQSSAILNFLDELCDEEKWGFPKSAYPMRGDADDPLARARITEVRTLAEECLVSWNPVRMFGTGAGTPHLHNAEASKEMAKWTKRTLTTIERWWNEGNRDVAALKEGGEGQVTMGDIVLYQFIEFIRACYGVNLLVGTGEKYKDVYGREQEEKFEKLNAFMNAMDTRKSVVREGREVPGSFPLGNMTKWVDGVWNEEERVEA